MNSKVILTIALVVAACMGITAWYYFQNPKETITSQECSELNGIVINAFGTNDYKDTDVIAPVNDNLCECLCVRSSQAQT